MNEEIEAEAAQFPEKEYINGIAVAVHIYHPGDVMAPHRSIESHTRIVEATLEEWSSPWRHRNSAWRPGG
jgi:hypothetical protein